MGFVIPFSFKSPHYLSTGPDALALFTEISKLESEILRLTELKNQENLTAAQEKEIEQKMAAASTRLSEGLFLYQKELARNARQALPAPRPPIPQIIKYRLPEVPEDRVPRIFVPRMPKLAHLSVDERKERFIQIVLPLILRANDEIRSQRQMIERAFQRGDKLTLKKFGQQYRVMNATSDKALYDALAVKVMPVPVSLALAQAAVESGWGQSRFTEAGNALFGQWVWNDSKGIKAKKASDQRASVRSFPDLLASVRAYMLNLNSFYAYEIFRENRHLYLQKKASFDSVVLGLSAYAQTGEDYVNTLKTVIDQNAFDRFNLAQLTAPRY